MTAGDRTDHVTLSREEADEIVNALRGIGNLVRGLTPKSGNVAEIYAVMSNLALIQVRLRRMPRVNSN